MIAMTTSSKEEKGLVILTLICKQYAYSQPIWKWFEGAQRKIKIRIWNEGSWFHEMNTRDRRIEKSDG